MGCCFSNDDKENDEADDPSRPLINPASGDAASRPISGYGSSTTERTQQKGDEQSALNRILHQTASNVIDVAALETHNMEQHEYLDRAQQYSNRLQSLGGQMRQSRSPAALPMGVAAPQVVLAVQPISLADVELITQAAEQSSRTLKEVKVRHKEDLVAPFGVP